VSGLTLLAEGASIRLQGEMTFATVGAALRGSTALFAAAGGDLQLNLAGIRRVDSAGLSLLLEWQRQMQQQQRQIHLSNVPHALQRLAMIGGVATLPPFAEPAEPEMAQ
jgi:phospholipid transport system transporter-binding protein